MDAFISSFPTWSRETQSRTRSKQMRSDIVHIARERQFFSAAKSGDMKKFRWFLENGYPIDMTENDDRKDTALIAACRLGRTDIVQLALEFDAKNDPHPEVTSDYQSALPLL